MTEIGIKLLLTKEEIRENVSARFRNIRLSLKLSPEQMGEKLGISRQNYSWIEHGHSLSVQAIVNMSIFAGVSLEDILINPTVSNDKSIEFVEGSVYSLDFKPTKNTHHRVGIFKEQTLSRYYFTDYYAQDKTFSFDKGALLDAIERK